MKIPGAKAAQRGMTLVEVMVIVCIVGVLAAVTVPALLDYSRRARVAEAADRLAYIYRMSTVYWGQERSARVVGPGRIERSFPPSVALTPAVVPSGQRVTDPEGTWTIPTWQALHFSLTEPHYYAYQYDATGANVGAAFTARALGDLDGNGVFGTFERAGVVDERMEVLSPMGLWIDRPME